MNKIIFFAFLCFIMTPSNVAALCTKIGHCEEGQYCDGDVCKPCDTGFYQEQLRHRDIACKPWTARHASENWIIVVNGSSTRDVKWDCIAGYVQRTFSLVQTECVLQTTTTTASSTKAPAENVTSARVVTPSTTRAAEVANTKDLLYLLLLIIIPIAVLVVGCLIYHKRCKKGPRSSIANRTVGDGSERVPLINVNGLNEFKKMVNDMGLNDARKLIRIIPDPSRQFKAQNRLHLNRANDKDVIGYHAKTLSDWLGDNPKIDSEMYLQWTKNYIKHGPDKCNDSKDNGNNGSVNCNNGNGNCNNGNGEDGGNNGNGEDGGNNGNGEDGGNNGNGEDGGNNGNGEDSGNNGNGEDSGNNGNGEDGGNNGNGEDSGNNGNGEDGGNNGNGEDGGNNGNGEDGGNNGNGEDICNNGNGEDNGNDNCNDHNDNSNNGNTTERQRALESQRAQLLLPDKVETSISTDQCFHKLCYFIVENLKVELAEQFITTLDPTASFNAKAKFGYLKDDFAEWEASFVDTLAEWKNKTSQQPIVVTRFEELLKELDQNQILESRVYKLLVTEFELSLAGI